MSHQVTRVVDGHLFKVAHGILVYLVAPSLISNASLALGPDQSGGAIFIAGGALLLRNSAIISSSAVVTATMG